MGIANTWAIISSLVRMHRTIILYLILIGNEYCVLVLSTCEPLEPDGTPVIDSSKSLCNPHVFNTAITRAESLVVAVGNPTSLLKTEKHMIQDPNYQEKGKCWSNYLRHCIENGTITFSKCLKATKEERDCYLAKVNEIVDDRLGRSVKVKVTKIAVAATEPLIL